MRVERLDLPLESGPYSIDRIESYPVRSLGTAVRYMVSDSSAPPIDLFVYPVGDRDLDAEAAAARSEMRFAGRTQRDLSLDIVGTDTLVVLGAPYPVLRSLAEGAIGPDSLRSYLFLTRVENRYLKFRATFSAASRHMLDRALRRRVESIIRDAARRAAE
ncbi:MAG TPA: hypothetical protein VF039_02760 [Longimicrobiales bacterium]